MEFVLLDQSTEATAGPGQGGILTPAVLSAIATSCDVQLNRDFATWWGGRFMVRPGHGPNDVARGEVVCLIVDTLPKHGVVAYHTADGNSHPYVFASRAMCLDLTRGDRSLSQAISHELLETAADEALNTWRDDLHGTEYAQEVCDPTEAQFYDVIGCAVSNFCLPAFFEPGAPGPWTFLGTSVPDVVAGPFSNAPNGYQTRRAAAEGGEAQVFGDIRPHRLEKVRHPSSRTFKRGARP